MLTRLSREAVQLAPAEERKAVEMGDECYSKSVSAALETRFVIMISEITTDTK
jgi:hypothetical protein